MKTFWLQLLGLVIIIMLGTFLTFNTNVLIPFSKLFNNNPPNQQVATVQKDMLRVIGGDNTTKAQLVIEIADTKEKRSKGLGFRQSLATDSGMLFIHESPEKYTYWMKGMQFPIDIIWIKDDIILDIIPNIPPPIQGQTDDTLERYSSTVEVNRALETNAGFVTSNNIQKGDKIIVEKAN